MGLAVEFQTITEMFKNVVKQFGHESRPVLMHKVDGAYKGISYRELSAMVERCSIGFSSLGMRSGDMVALISENRPEWVISDMAMIRLGAVNVPVYPTTTAKQVEYIFNDAGVKFAIVSNQMNLSKVLKVFEDVKSLQKIIVLNDRNLPQDARVIPFSRIMNSRTGIDADAGDAGATTPHQTMPEDLLTVIYTSGTTGNPKGVMLTHRNMASNIRSAATCLSISPDDTLLSFLPLCHSFERMAGYYTALACGATIAYAESIDTVRENILEIRPTMVASVPRLFERIRHRIMKRVMAQSSLKQKFFHWALEIGKQYEASKRAGGPSLPLAVKRGIAAKLVYGKLNAQTGGRLRFFVSGGAALPRELGEFFDAMGLPIIEGYGLSESSPVISVNTLDDRRFGTVGKPIPGVEVQIAADGEILARGPNIMKGYWNNPQATSEVIDKEGWLHTGDVGELTVDGYLRITDRKKHLFVSSGGKNIAPQPIENLFLANRYIDQFVLIGDGRMYCTALIVAHFDLLKERMRELNVSFASVDELVGKPEVRKIFEEEISTIQKDLPNYERVRKFTLLSNPLTVESGELTPTQKVRRKVVEEKYKDLIDKMYNVGG